MAHFLISKGYSSIQDPFNMPIPMLLQHYAYQQKIVKKDYQLEFAGNSILVAMQSGSKEAQQEYKNFSKSLNRRDAVK